MPDVNWDCCPLVAQTPIVRAFIEMPGEEQMNNSPRLSHHLGGLDESWLFVAPVVARRAENPSFKTFMRGCCSS